MLDPTTALASVATALGLLERIATLVKSVGDTKNKEALAELQEKLIQATGKIANLTSALAGFTAENYELVQEVQKIKDALKSAQDELKARPDRKFVDGVLWYRGDDQPYCGQCRGKFDRDIPVVRQFRGYKCSTCPSSWVTPQPPPDFGIAPKNYES